MSRLLFGEYPLLFSSELATLIGLNEAIMFQQIHYWITNPKAIEREGKKWHYDSYKEWRKQFPFWCERTIERIASKLEGFGLVVSKQFNKLKGDRTKWYTIDYYKLDLITKKSEKPTYDEDETDLSDQCDLMLPPHDDNLSVCPPPMTTDCRHDDDRLSSSYSTKTSSKTSSNKQQQQDPIKPNENVVVDLDFLIKHGVEKSLARAWIDKYGEVRCQEVSQYVNKRQERVDNPAGYIRKLLETNASLSTKKEPSRHYLTPEETKANQKPSIMVSKSIPEDFYKLVKKLKMRA